MKLLITCEHGGNRVPAQYRQIFCRHRESLASHRGYDPGALALARDLANSFGAELVYSTTSRLLVELNRSLTHPQLFSEVSRALPPLERQRILKRYYHPYRDRVEALVRGAGERVIHISCHSFTPVLDGAVRRADVGLLYDPRREAETRLCKVWQRELRREAPELIVRRNYPYRGYDDGLTTFLRRRYPDSGYSGVEIEVNQKHTTGDAADWRALRRRLRISLSRALTHESGAE